jgi:uncharacterized protein YeeX (DUF496 family)
VALSGSSGLLTNNTDQLKRELDDVQNQVAHASKKVCLFVCLMVFSATFNNIQLYRGGQFYW